MSNQGKALPPATTAETANTLEIEQVPGKRDARVLTDLVADGVALNAILSLRFVEKQLGSMSATEMMGSLKERGEAVNRGDLAASERLLYAQAVTLNAIFAELAARSQTNMGSHFDAMDRYMRLALKAQGQWPGNPGNTVRHQEPAGRVRASSQHLKWATASEQRRRPHPGAHAHDEISFRAERTFRGPHAWQPDTGHPSKGGNRPRKSRLGARGRSQPARARSRARPPRRVTPGEAGSARRYAGCRRK